jgi:predicted nucleic acid-binding protein
MIVVDTNVLSELMKASPAESVTRWIANHPAQTIYTTSITQAEILLGVQLLPAGRKRDAIRAAAEAIFSTDFQGRILPFGSGAAPIYARIAAERRRTGRPISQHDAQIAAITSLEKAELATRNVTDFEGCGIRVVDPWS